MKKLFFVTLIAAFLVASSFAQQPSSKKSVTPNLSPPQSSSSVKKTTPSTLRNAQPVSISQPALPMVSSSSALAPISVLPSISSVDTASGDGFLRRRPSETTSVSSVGQSSSATPLSAGSISRTAQAPKTASVLRTQSSSGAISGTGSGTPPLTPENQAASVSSTTSPGVHRGETLPIIPVSVVSPMTPRAKSVLGTKEDQVAHSPGSGSRISKNERDQIKIDIKKTYRFGALKRFLDHGKYRYVAESVADKFEKFKSDYDSGCDPKFCEPIDLAGLSSRARIEL